MLASSYPSDHIAKRHDVAQIENHISMARPNPGAPIARVLNDEAPILHVTQAGIIAPTPPTTGRPDDCLLNDLDSVNKRKKGVQQPIQAALGGCEIPVIKLPKLPQLPKRTTRRPRIPPLLQGLHQPPPLPPEGKLFPPITSEKNSFAGNPGERVGLDLFAEENRSRLEDEHIDSGVSMIGMNRDAHQEEKMGEHHATLKSPILNWPLQLEESNILISRGNANEASGRNKRSRKRNKWSEQETKDLLIGVSRFGIGSWKKILHDPDFDFNGRTAVDWYFTLSR